MVFASKNLLILLGIAFLAVSSLAEESAPTCDAPDCEKKTDTESDEMKKIGDFFEEDFVEEGFPEGHPFNDLPDIKPIPENIPDMDNLPPPKMPDLTNGGVMVFFHFYKTGGSTITEGMMMTKADLEEDFTEFEDEIIYFVNNREDMTGEDILDSVHRAKEDEMAVFYNFHVEFPETMYPTLVESAPLINAWREYAESQGVPFFAATVLREPLGHSLSFFNFFHVAIDNDISEWNPFKGDLQPTEENFLKTYVPNRLCHLIYNDAHGILEAPDFALVDGLLEHLPEFMDEDELNRRNEPSHCDLEAVRKILFGGTFDYIGVTERLSTHIVPMFMKMVFGDEKLADEVGTKKDATLIFEADGHELPPLKKHALSESTKEKVLKESAKDQQLYEEARDRFAHWPQFS